MESSDYNKIQKGGVPITQRGERWDAVNSVQMSWLLHSHWWYHSQRDSRRERGKLGGRRGWWMNSVKVMRDTTFACECVCVCKSFIICHRIHKIYWCLKITSSGQQYNTFSLPCTHSPSTFQMTNKQSKINHGSKYSSACIPVFIFLQIDQFLYSKRRLNLLGGSYLTFKHSKRITLSMKLINGVSSFLEGESLKMVLCLCCVLNVCFINWECWILLTTSFSFIVSAVYLFVHWHATN